MTIKFVHKSGGIEYWLEGTTVCWNSTSGKGVQRTHEYDQTKIDKYFAEGTWIITSGSLAELVMGGVNDKEVKATSVARTAEGVSTKAVASDGGSSTYYDIGLPQWLVDKIVERQKEGTAYVKTEELIEVGFGNDFDASNIFKSLVRAWGAFNGGGKKGNTVDYDLNKMNYSTEKLRQRAQRKQGAAQ